MDPDFGLSAGRSAREVAEPTTGRPLTALPGSRLWVMARLDALLEEGLALQDWGVCEQSDSASPRRAA